MIVKFINLSYFSLSCYNDINNRNILFHCFKLSGYRQLAMTHAYRDDGGDSARWRQAKPHLIAYGI
jgi:hypothetical protein